MFPKWSGFYCIKKLRLFFCICFSGKIFPSGNTCKKKETILRIFTKTAFFVKKIHKAKKKSLFPGKKDILVRKRPFSGLSH